LAFVRLVESTCNVFPPVLLKSLGALLYQFLYSAVGIFNWCCPSLPPQIPRFPGVELEAGGPGCFMGASTLSLENSRACTWATSMHKTAFFTALQTPKPARGRSSTAIPDSGPPGPRPSLF
jgi:hypothetical protein